MRIDKRLNLTLALARAPEDGGTIHLHSVPVSRETFDQYFLVISKTFTQLYRQGLDVAAGPRVAAMMLKRVAQDLGEWEGPAGVENGLMNEIRRLTNVIVPGAQGWDILPLADAIKQDFFSDGDVSEVENLLCFFTVNSVMLRRDEAPAMLAAAADLWGGQVSYSSCTELKNSLPTSTAIATSQASAPAAPQQPAGPVVAGSSVPR